MAGKYAQCTFAEGAPIEGLEHFLGEIKGFAGPGALRLYFRGQDQPTSELLPSIGRKHYYVGREIAFTPQQERDLLRRFRRHAYEYFKRVPTEWETLFLARHHGLPTRLLDWTANPLVALYFAAFYENDEFTYQREGQGPGTIKLNLDGTVWAVERRGEDRHDLDVFTEGRSPLEIPGIKLVYPFYPSPRMTAQSGIFTLHGDPWTDMVKSAGRRYPRRDLDIARLKRWRVPSRHKTRIILDLERLAINSRTLFPDLDGLATGLWQTEVIREAFKGNAECGVRSAE